MNTRLTTPDGFPRADLDVAQSKDDCSSCIGATTNAVAVRTTRSRIIYLRNDYKALMNVIEKHIHEHFARQAENGSVEEATSSGSQTAAPEPLVFRAPQQLGPPFAKVNSVVSGSPAESAGLKAGDEIRNFGYVNHTNHDGLKRVGECVQGNEEVTVTPRSRLLGCFC